MATKPRPWRQQLVTTLVMALSLALWAPDTHAAPSLWSRAQQPSSGEAESIGGYSAGCVRGAAELPAAGEGFTLMRPSRRRGFGHPVLVAYLERIAKKIKQAKVGPILIGDMGQPMGGPAKSGHASHQSGLDVDIWFWHPKVAEKRKLKKRERESLSAHAVVDQKKKTITSYWDENISTMLRIAASEPEVSKIFVNPLIKQRLCESDEEDRAYLNKVRPWYGHADHMHVRLVCPEGSEECTNQDPLPEGDGCSELSWWFDEEAQAARKEAQAKYQGKVGALPELPATCNEMGSAHSASGSGR